MGRNNGGTRPKPTALKVLAGTRADRINDSEPVPPPGTPQPPTNLSKEARAYWMSLVPRLVEMGVATLADEQALILHVETWQIYRNLLRLAKKNDGNAIIQLAKYAGLLQRQLVEFGATPSSRSRISVERKEEQDPLEALLARKKG